MISHLSISLRGNSSLKWQTKVTFWLSNWRSYLGALDDVNKARRSQQVWVMQGPTSEPPAGAHVFAAWPVRFAQFVPKLCTAISKHIKAMEVTQKKGDYFGGVVRSSQESQ